MQAVFYITALLGLAFFLFAKRRFDFYSLAFFSAVIYFLPGFVGFALIPVGTTLTAPSPLVDETYAVMILVLLAIPVGAMLYDRIGGNRSLSVHIPGSDLTGIVATLIGFGGFVLTLLTVGDALFAINKLRVLDALNRWYIVWTMGAAVGAVVLFSQGKWAWLPLPFFLLLADAYVIANRSALALTVVSLFLIFLSRSGTIRLVIDKWKLCCLGTFIFMLLLLYATIRNPVKLGDWNTVATMLFSGKTYIVAIAQSEPFIIQGILNKIIENQFQVGMYHLTYVLYQFVLFAPNLGVDSVSFNSLFQPALFPGYQWGLANNIWAQMWSAGGWTLLFLFVAVFNCSLGILNALLKLRNSILQGGFVLLGCYFAFYIHRNDLSYQVALEKRVFLFFLVCLLISIIISGALRIRQSRAGRERMA